MRCLPYAARRSPKTRPGSPLFLVNPHGLLAQEFRKPLLAGVVTSGIRRRPNHAITFAANSVGMGSEAMDELIEAVDFPKFLSGLIDGVFNAIVKSSIEQMEAYAELVAAVSKSVKQFANDNISVNAVRDALASEFPDAFCWTKGSTRRLRLHAQPGSPPLARVASTLGLREPVVNPALASEVGRVVAAARRRVARNRQQILATMLLMGINRLVVTNG